MNAKYIQQFKKGSLEMMLLALIAKKETYGYEIITALNDRSGSLLGYAREGTVYPILYRLEDSGLISSRLAPAAANGGMKKFYAITEAGRQTLAELHGFWLQYVQCANGFMEE